MSASGPSVIARLGAIGAPAGASADEMMKRRFLVYMGSLMSGGGLLWGSISAAYGLWLPALIPYGYTVATIVNLTYFHLTKDFRTVRFFQVLISLLLPFFFQWVLGGWVASGVVMLWAMLAIVGAMTFSAARSVLGWLALYVVLCIFSALIDAPMAVRFHTGASVTASTIFWVLNIVIVSSAVFGLIIYLGFEREKVNRALEEANSKITLLNERLEEEVSLRTRELQESLSQSRAFLDNLADGVTAIGKDGRVQITNPALAEMLSLEDTVAGVAASAVLPAVLVDLATKSIATDAVQKADVSLPNDRVGAAVASPIHAGDGDGVACLGSVVIVRDVTLEKEVDRMKTDFITTVSHELRTPLTSVLGFAKVTKNKLESSVFPLVPVSDASARRVVDQIARNIDIIVSEGERLTALINDVLDISKMEAGHVEWKKTHVAPGQLVQRAIEATRALFLGDVRLLSKVEEGLPDVIADSDRLLQVLINLVSNASKFTTQGTVTVAVQRASKGIEFSVTDTGPGIEEGDHASIFEKFRQVGDTLTNKPKGTGLGLPICKQIVAAHDGRIGVTSRLGAGARFFFLLPVGGGSLTSSMNLPRVNETALLLARIEKHVDEAIPAKLGGSVLVVDDDANLRELVRQQLVERGYTVRQAASGAEAIETVRERKPDLIILDVMMPGLSGFDVAAILKSDPETRAIPIIILSIVHDEDRGYSVGVDKYLSKPAEGEALAAEVRRLIKNGQSPRRVLVVNEQMPLANEVVRLLQAKGYDVVGTCAANEFVAEAKRAMPDLIVMEAGHPSKDDIFQAIRLEKELSNVFVVQLVSDAKKNAKT